MTAVKADVHRASRGTFTLKQFCFVQNRVMRSASYYIKHYASIMPDATLNVEVDDHGGHLADCGACRLRGLDA